MANDLTRGNTGETKIRQDADIRASQHVPSSADAGELVKLRLENAILRAALLAEQSVAGMVKPRPAFHGRFSFVEKVIRGGKTGSPSGILLNSPDDIMFAHRADDFKDIVHVFHKEWLGIRAAAGSLPGAKLAINAGTKLSHAEVREFFRAIDQMGAKKFVFHGMSENAANLVRRLAKVGLAEQIFLVQHGNVSQWCYEPERTMALEIIELVRTGQAKRLHFMKKVHPMAEGKSYLPMLLNMSPVVPVAFTSGHRTAGTALMPGTDDWRKNLHCNALGAALSSMITTVIHYAKNVELPSPYSNKLRRAQYVNRSATLRLMALCECTLYASLVECHPMVNLESEAVGTPCLRGPLNLDAFEEHSYARLAEVADPTNVYEVKTSLERLLSVPAEEMRGMIKDYLQQINRVSLERYREFLEV